ATTSASRRTATSWRSSIPRRRSSGMLARTAVSTCMAASRTGATRCTDSTSSTPSARTSRAGRRLNSRHSFRRSSNRARAPTTWARSGAALPVRLVELPDLPDLLRREGLRRGPRAGKCEAGSGGGDARHALFRHQREGPHRAAGRHLFPRSARGHAPAYSREHAHVLPALVGVGDRRGDDRRAGLELPEPLAVVLVERDYLAGQQTREQQPAVGREHARRTRQIRQRRLPYHISGQRLDRRVIAYRLTLGRVE